MASTTTFLPATEDPAFRAQIAGLAQITMALNEHQDNAVNFGGGPKRTKQHNLSTFNGWLDKAEELLQGKPYGTALVDPYISGYYALIDDSVCSIDASSETDLYSPEATYSEDFAACVDPRTWSGKAWDGSSPEESQRPLLTPRFVTLKLMPGATS